MLVAGALTLVPSRLRKHWYALTGIMMVVFGSAPIYTAVEHPSDVFAGATTGMAITILMYRLFAPEAAFPITYRAGKTAHLDVGGARGAAIKSALLDQLSIDAHSVRPVNLASSSGSTPSAARGLLTPRDAEGGSAMPGTARHCRNHPRARVPLGHRVLGRRSRDQHAEVNEHFTDEEISEAFAATRGITMPSQLRRSVRRDGRRLLAEFRALVPHRTPVAIQRWTLRRAALTFGYGMLAIAIIAVFVSGLADIGLV